MLKLLLFLRKIHYVLLFLVLEAVAISFFVSGNPYQRARIVNASNVALGGVNGVLADIRGYFGLRQANQLLMSEVARLRGQLTSIEQTYVTDTTLIHALGKAQELNHINTVSFKVASVVGSTISRRDNFITINCGRRDGIAPDMALVNDLGIVGYVLDCSDNYSVGLSVLNVSDFKTSGKIKGSDFTGSISWDGLNYRVVDFTQVPKYANISLGDTIVTTDYSNIFPADMPIGTVVDYTLTDGAFYNARVYLFADMSALNHVYVVTSRDRVQRDSLETALIPAVYPIP